MIVLHAGAIVLLLGGCFGAAFVLQPFGQRQWALATVAIALVWSLAELGRTPGHPAASSTRWERTLGRPLFPERVALAAALGCWLGLIVWSAFSPAGDMPREPTNPAAIRVVTWNILLGRDGGWPWNQHDWPVRKRALERALAAAKPDILCVQEALAGQLSFLAAVLPSHHRVGVGRDDGRSAGEHCAVYFDHRRFEEAGTGTFWLEEPADRPPERLIFGPKRICTWVRLRDRRSGRYLRVYNTHNYLTESAQLAAMRLILGRLGSGDPTDAILLAGDFNAAPGAPSRRVLDGVGLASAAVLASKPEGTPTYQFYGIRIHSFDEIFLGRGWRVLDRRVLNVKPQNTFPSDHFGVMADVLFEERPP
jgi:endonuclease/exonuclease/phosphatase family metal-dependent hydrolase